MSEEMPGPESSEGRFRWRAWVAKLPRNPRTVALSLGLGLLGTGALALAGLAGAFYYYSRDLPRVPDLGKHYAPPQITRILAKDGTELGSIFYERRTVVPFSAIPDYVKTAFLAAEDASFYQHQGLNYLGLLRAVLRNLQAGRLRQGGSTITQQVVKNVLLTQERTAERKIKETILAYQIESSLSKDQILAIYLNHLYLGHGRYGVEEASRYYFGKHVGELRVAEAALLAGIVASPERYSPAKNLELAKKRRHYVLEQMWKKGFMTEPVFHQAEAEPIMLAPSSETESDLAPEFVTAGMSLLGEVTQDGVQRGGFTITTTVDPELQAAARRAVRHGLDNYLRRAKVELPLTLKKRRLWGEPHKGSIRRYGIYTGTVVSLDDERHQAVVQVGPAQGVVQVDKEERYNPKHLPASQVLAPGASVRVRVEEDPAQLAPGAPLTLKLELGPEAALVAIEVATGQVVAQVGSYEGLRAGLDRAVRSRRQPGSAFKPLFYSAALDQGKVTAASVFAFPKAAASAPPAGAEPQQPPELDIFSLRQGIAVSENRVARATFERVGGAQVVNWAKQLGIQSHLGDDESLALGSYEVTPLELARAYTAFASGGMLSPVTHVTKIESGSGDLPLSPGSASRVMRPEVAFLMTDLLTSVVREGTGRLAKSLGVPLAGKTGTTNKAKDAWFAGYSPEYVVVVWVGYDDALPLGGGESGAVTALPIWVEFMKTVLARRPSTEFSRPPGLVEATIDPKTGFLALPEQEGARVELFLPGTEPTELAPPEIPPPDVAAPTPPAPPETEGERPTEAMPKDADAPDEGSIPEVLPESPQPGDPDPT